MIVPLYNSTSRIIFFFFFFLILFTWDGWLPTTEVDTSNPAKCGTLHKTVRDSNSQPHVYLLWSYEPIHINLELVYTHLLGSSKNPLGQRQKRRICGLSGPNRFISTDLQITNPDSNHITSTLPHTLKCTGRFSGPGANKPTVRLFSTLRLAAEQLTSYQAWTPTRRW